MARKLDLGSASAGTDSDFHHDRGPIADIADEQRLSFPRRVCVKLGVMSALSTLGLLASTAPAGAENDAAQRVAFTGTGSPASYDITVSGDLATDPDAGFDAAANISGRNAEGVLIDGTHSYVVDGEITDIRTTGSPQVTLNGQVIDTDTTNTIQFSGVDQPANYEVTVSGTIRSPPDSEHDLSDNISGANAEGTLGEDPHIYHFTGDLSDLRIDGHVDVLVNGAPISA